jgi:hypothetical protein
MLLNFPNQSRWYDATLRAVRFWSHDSAMEAAFFIEEGALGYADRARDPTSPRDNEPASHATR